MKSALNYPGLDSQPDQGQSSGVLFQYLKRFLRAQFGRPTGPCGYLAGMLMARTPSNLDRIRWTLSLLDVRPNHRILEIGFGPGIAIQLLSKVVADGSIVGIDHSEVMLEQARKRNARAVRNGRVSLHLGSVLTVPPFPESFDRIFTINSIHFWDKPVDCLKTLHTWLRPGGLIAVTVQPRSRNATDATARVMGNELAANLERAGFSQCRLEIRQAKPVAVACALGTK